MPEQALVKDIEARMNAAIDTLTREFASVRTGRASTGLLETVRVDYYGTLTAVSQMASVVRARRADAAHPAVGGRPAGGHREGDPQVRPRPHPGQRRQGDPA